MLDHKHTDDENNSSKANDEKNPALFIFDDCKLHLACIFKQWLTKLNISTLSNFVFICIDIAVLHPLLKLSTFLGQ